MLSTILNAAKAVGGFAAPWIAKGIALGVAALGITDVTQVQIDNTSMLIVSVVVGLLVYFVPNKEKSVS
jgi:hypothetical protein